jgi:signal transduction histidine kinase
VRSEASSIRLIVSNLVSNAVHATPGEGRVSVEVSGVELDPTAARARPGLREGRYGRIVVRDSGVGMDAATVQRCFEPFFTTKRTKSAGLGLAMVHGLVQDQGGSVWIDSTLGQGTTVTVLLPVSHATTAPDDGKDLPSAPVPLSPAE